MTAPTSRVLTIGGTFNPVHTGHLRLAIEAAEALGFDRIDWIPCFAPRHKSGSGLLPFELRRRLLTAATAGLPGSAVDDIESRLPTPSFTIQTLEALAARDQTVERHFALGQEEFVRLPKWYRGREVVSFTHIVVAARTGLDIAQFRCSVEDAWPDCRPIDAPAGALAGYELVPGRRAVLLPLPRLEISASLVRERWLAGRNLDHLVAPAALAMLEANRKIVTAAWEENQTGG